MNFMKTDYELKRSKRKTLSLTVTKDLKVSVKAPVGCPQKTIDDFVLSHEKWINEHIEKQKSRLSLEKTLDEKRVSELRALAAAELPRRVEYYSEKMGLYPTSVKITSAATRFGSCSGKNSICFSYRLMHYPPEAVDYVVVHELAHIKEKNHSARFYALVEKYMPDYREREKLLKKTPKLRFARLRYFYFTLKMSCAFLPVCRNRICPRGRMK